MDFHRWERTHPQRAERETRINLRPSKPSLRHTFAPRSATQHTGMCALPAKNEFCVTSGKNQ